MIAFAEFKAQFHHAYRSMQQLEGGRVSNDLPKLENANPNVFSMCAFVHDRDSQRWHKLAAGNVDTVTSAQSVSKIVTEALVRDLLPGVYPHLIGSEYCGDAYNAATLDELHRPVNGMMNFGAIANCILLHNEQSSLAEALVLNKWKQITGEDMHIDEHVFQEDKACLRRGDYDAHRATFYQTNAAGKKLAATWKKYGILLTRANADAGMQLFLRLCSMNLTVEHLAKAGAVFANGGLHPLTVPNTEVFTKAIVDAVNVSMLHAGMYAESKVIAKRTNGLPCKSGISGALTAHSGNRLPTFGFGSYGPRLNPQGNSIQGVAALELLSRKVD